MPDACNFTIMGVDPSCHAIAVSCAKCREVAFYTDPETAGRAGAHHALECLTDDILIVELMSP